MKKRPLSTQVEEWLLEEMRAAVVQLAGPPERLTIVELIARGISYELWRLSKKHNEGRPFTAYRGYQPKTGPRAKA